ncbi:hypothetical protein ACWGDS_10270 [Streptomyces sp. NPDC055059]|uniref:hypothetical protein n=1 Tax=Streptomyces sp. NPDC127172 TaxID=3345382 RepID=UPI00362953B3
MAAAGVPRVPLVAKEGLALLDGTSFSCAQTATATTCSPTRTTPRTGRCCCACREAPDRGSRSTCDGADARRRGETGSCVGRAVVARMCVLGKIPLQWRGQERTRSLGSA